MKNIYLSVFKEQYSIYSTTTMYFIIVNSIIKFFYYPHSFDLYLTWNKLYS